MTEIARQIVYHQAEVGRGLGVIVKTATMTGIREFEILRFAKTMQVDLIVQGQQCSDSNRSGVF